MKEIFLTKLKEWDERIYFQKNRLVIFNNNEIRLKILQLTHDSFNVKHFKKIKQYDLIRRVYW